MIYRPLRTTDEFDQAFFDAFALVETRVASASTRLGVAAAAVNAQAGAPRKAADLCAELAWVWGLSIGKRPTVSRNNGVVSGDFATFCWLSHALLPADEQKFAPMSDDRIAEAARPIGKTKRPKA